MDSQTATPSLKRQGTGYIILTAAVALFLVLLIILMLDAWLL